MNYQHRIRWGHLKKIIQIYCFSDTANDAIKLLTVKSNRSTVVYFAQFTDFDDAMIVDIRVISISPSKLTEMNFLYLGLVVPEFTKVSAYIFSISLKTLYLLAVLRLKNQLT